MKVTPKLNRNSVVLSFRLNNHLYEIYTGVTTKKENWSSSKKNIKGEGEIVYEKNKRIKDLIVAIESYVLKIKNEGKEYFHDELKLHLSSITNNEEKKTSNDFIQYFDTYLDSLSHKFSNQTIKAYITTKRHFKKYLKSKGKIRVKFESLNVPFLDGFVNYLNITQNLSPATRGKHIKNIKAIMNYALKEKLHNNRDFQLVSKESEDTSHVYLNEDELKSLNEFSFKIKAEQNVIDVFLFICWTGIRYGDYFNLNKNNIIEEIDSTKKIWYLNFIQEKTRKEVKVPILYKEAINLMRKYKYELPKLSNPYLNRMIKKILTKYELIGDIIQIKKEKKVGEFPKRDLISVHTGRRSFCTNQYIRGTPSQFIMAASGHETESAFRKYIKANQIDKSKGLINYINY